MATEKDIREIVALHQQVFDGFFLTSMGGQFLYELYFGFLWEESGVLLVARNDDELLGFIAGSTNPKKFFPNLLRKRWWFFFSKATFAALRNPRRVAKKMISAIFFRGDIPYKIKCGAVLSSIGVSNRSRGTPVAGELLKSFEAQVLHRGVDTIFLTTDVENNERANAFYLKNNYTVESELQKSGGRFMYRYVKCLVEERSQRIA